MLRLMNIEALTLPVFTVLDSRAGSQQRCAKMSCRRSAPRVFGIDNKLGAYRFAQFEMSQSRQLYRSTHYDAKPLGAASDPDFGVYNAQA